jgi:hypothetical protein
MKRTCSNPNCGAELAVGALTCHICHAEQDLAANWGSTGREALELPPDRETTSGPPVLLRAGDQATLQQADSLALETGKEMIIGRESKNKIGRVLNRYDDVSRVHLELLVTGPDEVQVTDRSRSGTYLHNRRLPKNIAHDLRLPIYLRLGDYCWLHVERTPQ